MNKRPSLLDYLNTNPYGWQDMPAVRDDSAGDWQSEGWSWRDIPAGFAAVGHGINNIADSISPVGKSGDPNDQTFGLGLDYGEHWRVPPIIQGPINALSRLAANSLDENGYPAVPDIRDPQNQMDTSTGLLSFFGGQALNPSMKARGAVAAAVPEAPPEPIIPNASIHDGRLPRGGVDWGVYKDHYDGRVNPDSIPLLQQYNALRGMNDMGEIPLDAYDISALNQQWRDKVRRTGELFADNGKPSLLGSAVSTNPDIIARHQQWLDRLRQTREPASENVSPRPAQTDAREFESTFSSGGKDYTAKGFITGDGAAVIGEIGGKDGAPGKNTLSRAALRSWRDQFLQENPDVTLFMGDRISGARDKAGKANSIQKVNALFSDSSKPSLLGSAVSSTDHSSPAALAVNQTPRVIDLWHYSPRNFDKFDHSLSDGLQYSQGSHFYDQHRPGAAEYGKGNPWLYQAQLSATPDQIMDWWKPFDEQPQAVRDIGMTHVPVPEENARFVSDMHASWKDLRKRTGMSDAEISNALAEKGIKAVKHTNGEYVVMAPDEPKIVHKWAPDGTQLFSDTSKPSLLGSALAQEQPQGITAYHGSPHDFDKFDISKIGTGEGAQAYGHGLYFAENEGVAKSYKDALAQDGLGQVARGWLRQNGGDIDKTIEFLRGRVARTEGSGEPIYFTSSQALQELESAKANGLTPGHMYQVRINADPNDFLDWDKPLSGQSEKVRQGVGAKLAELTGKEISPEFYGSFGESGAGVHNLFSAWSKHKQDGVAGALREAGIPGIRYLDQGSRTDGTGTYNYAVFDDSIIEILKKYGMLPPAIGLGASYEAPDQNW